MLTNLFRWIHILGGAAWFGEVATVAFVLVPALRRAEPAKRAWLLQNVFPTVFRLASVLVGMAWVGGVGLYLSMHGWRIDWAGLVGTRWGRSILVGGVLGFLLGLFHYTLEERLEGAAIHATGEADERVLRYLTIIPRVGLGIIVVIIVSMMYAARGF